MKKTVIKNPIIINKFAKGNTYTPSLPSLKYSYNVSADSGSICIRATLIKIAPANVAPIVRKSGLCLKDLERIGKVPKNKTIPKKASINKTLRIGSNISLSIKYENRY